MNECKDIKKSRNDTLRLSKEFIEKYFDKINKDFSLTDFYIIMDDIRNYRILTEEQLSKLDKLTETEKIEIIKLYNTMFSNIENLLH